METTDYRYPRKLFLYLLGLFLLLGMCSTVQAAAKVTYKVKVNNTYAAALEKRGNHWFLQPEAYEEAEDRFQGGIQYLQIPKGKEFSTGYYYFYKNGRLDSARRFHKLDKKVNGRRFRGEYYFGNENGRLYMKRGWITVRNKKYYLSSTGRRYTNCWKGGYYLKSSGEIAKSMKTPDGYYVDCDGRRCKEDEVRLSSLKKSLESAIKGLSGTWSVYVKDLKTDDTLTINPVAMYPASVIKLFEMEYTYEQIQKGKLKKTASVTDWLREMITVSDNNAFNRLIALHSQSGSFLQGCKAVNQYVKKNGYARTEFHNSLEPSSLGYVSDGNKNKSTVKDAGMLLERIYKGKCVSKKYSKEMLKLLLKQTRRWKIPAGLPTGVKVANKTGENNGYQHDTAIVYGKKTNYVVCIFSNSGEYSGIQGIKSLSAKIYNYLN